MSMNTSIMKLDTKFKRRIVACLYQSGCDKSDVDLLVQTGKLKDVADLVDLEDIFY